MAKSVVKEVGVELCIPRDEFEAITTLYQNAVEYLLIGGYALRFYGFIRPKKDVDLLIHNSPENARRAFASLQSLMTYVPMKLSFTENDLTKPCLRLDLRKCGYALDILTSVAGLDFATAYRNQETASQSGIAIPVS